MTPRQQRRFRKQFDAQVEAERNGAPPPPEIAARMTKPRKPQAMYQVMATVKGTRELLPVGPMMLKSYAEELAAVINRFVLEGKERTWSSATVVPMTPISAGVH